MMVVELENRANQDDGFISAEKTPKDQPECDRGWPDDATPHVF